MKQTKIQRRAIPPSRPQVNSRKKGKVPWRTFKKYFNQCKNLDSCLMKEWFEFQRGIWSNDDGAVQNPMSLLRCFQVKCRENKYYFNNFEQNDVDEFLTLFLDLLHQSIKRRVKISYDSEVNDEGDKIVLKSLDEWKRFYENDYSYIIDKLVNQIGVIILFNILFKKNIFNYLFFQHLLS